MNVLRAPVVWSALLLVALFLPSAAQADVIHLESGGRYRGKIVSENARWVTIKTPGGKIKVPRTEISRIVREEDLAATFKTRFKALEASRDVAKWCALGTWAREKKLEKQAVRCFEQAVKLDGRCKPARLALDHKLHEGTWYTPDEYRSKVLGLVRHKDRWVTPADKTKLDAGLVEIDGRWVIPKSGEPTPARKPKAKRPKPVARKEKKTARRSGRGATFKAMSFNIRYDFKNDGRNRWQHRVEAVAKVIKTAPVVGIQEDKGGQVDDLRPHLPGYEIVGGGRNATGSGERCSILVKRSKGKIREWGEFWLSDTPDVKGSNTWRDRYPRKVTWALIDLKGARSKLLMLNTHFPEKTSGRDPENRVRGARVMNEFLRKRVPKKERSKIAVIVMGDYNSSPEEEPRKTLVGSGANGTGLRDSWSEGPHPSFGGTFNGFSGRRGNHRIDWILVGGPLKVKRCDTFAEKVDGRWPSDHYPITVDLDLR